MLRQRCFARVEPLFAVLQRRKERARGILAGTVHVRNLRDAVGPEVEPLRPIVPTGRRGGINERQLFIAESVDGLAVEIDLYVRHTRFPAELERQGRIVERPRRRVDDVPLNAAVFVDLERPHSKFDEAVLAEKSLPALRGAPRLRRYHRTAGSAGRVRRRAIGGTAIPGAGNPQISR